ncbi:hypothetical protein [Streptomyces roseochromogenus]|uniref:Uncharacterized protein n=1 Tax=Streptomyces roseochromogenus subsp. oscitans DS 12.976 TaxID=1352936 RepID=V6KT94_STRRC|nr:hypothetical protein [Streptomyces roseochromogenus]EST35415.1 hypothetical protein M878_06230 [Streptomyces roseochromogenus subsp. oscitans DS 12.976]
MPLAVEIVLIVIGVLLLATALIGSGISRRLMTIPKMHRVPRVALAVLGVLLVAGGMWGLSTGTAKHAPTLAELRARVPSDVKQSMDCTEATEAPKNAVELDCGTQNAVPDHVWYIMFPDVNSMQHYWMTQAGTVNLQGTQCVSLSDYTKGSKTSYYLSDQAITDGDDACTMDGNSPVIVYTDRRYNIVVIAEESDPQKFSEFNNWIATSQPAGPRDATPATPSQTPDGS